MVVPNLASGIKHAFVWVDAVPTDGELVKFFILVWNETVNTHQSHLYLGLILNQFYWGYLTVKDKQFIAHRDHMQAAAMLILGPLFQRFPFNHLTDRRDEFGVLVQVVTYTILMMVLRLSVAKNSVQITLGVALMLALVFVSLEKSSLRFLLAVVQ